jgi:glucokinase
MTPERVAIGVDVGGTFIKFGVVRRDGTILRGHSLPTNASAGPDAVLERIATGIAQLLAESEEEIAGIGLGVPGVINDRGEIAYPPNFPGWEIVPVAERLRPLLSTTLPIAVENDANVAGYAEAHAGSGLAGDAEKNFLFVTLGTGVGGCIIYDGKIWRGASGGAGEIGHTTVDMNGPVCNCGARGCIEAYIGQRYMSALATGRLEREHDSLLHAMVAAQGSLTPKLLDEAAVAGDRFAREFLAEMGEILGAGLASAMNLLDLPLVIVGGGMSKSDRFLLEPARRSLERRVLRSLAGKVELRAARFLNDAGMIGAALLAMDA